MAKRRQVAWVYPGSIFADDLRKGFIKYARLHDWVIHRAPQHYAEGSQSPEAWLKSFDAPPDGIVVPNSLTKKELIETNPSISEIAAAFGYSGEFHLVRFFRCQTGMTPLELRKTHGRR